MTDGKGGRRGMERKPPTLELEQHYTIAEVAKALHLSRDFMRRIVRDEEGVIRIEESGKKTVYRIPQRVVARLIRRHANPGVAA